MNDPTLFDTLRAFRAGVYTCLGARRDALFEALDAATSVGPVPALAYLSLAALHRRGWGSLYAALAEGSLDISALRALVGHPPPGRRPAALRRGYEPPAAHRRRDQPRAGLLLLGCAAVGRPTDRDRLVGRL